MTDPSIPREPSATQVLGRYLVRRLCELAAAGWTVEQMADLLRSGWYGSDRQGRA